MRPQLITSPSNRLIRDALEVRDRRRKSAPDRVFVEGPRLIETALAAGTALDHLFFTRSFAARPRGRALIRSAGNATAPPREQQGSEGTVTSVCVEVDDRVMSLLSGTVTPQGVAAVVRMTRAKLDSLTHSDVPLLVVCDGIQDPGNLGAIIRTADAAGADAVVVLPDTCDPLGDKTVRATAGSVFHIPVILCAPDSLVRYAGTRGLTLYVADSRGTASLYDTDLTGPVALIFGSEAHGASGGMRATAQGTIRVPLYGRAESLNVGIAAALCIYETVRQRKTSSIPCEAEAHP